MKRIVATAFARAGLAGNPSDGYFGKTLSVSIRDFAARVVVYDWPTLEILPSEQDHVRFDSLDELAADVRLNGYYGGLRLVKASLKKFHDYCVQDGIDLPPRNFSIRYETDIPRQVGLAGSSAIITASFRALMQFYGVDIPRHILPNWVLATEREELGIGGGLQDRVCQAYEGLVFMDFDQEKMLRDGFGHYEPLDPRLLPPIYLAYQARLSEVSAVVHNDLRKRWEAGDPQVVGAMLEFASYAQRARDCLVEGRTRELAAIMDANFDLRRRIIAISPENLRMVETARACSASAKFAGSGGAIVGVYPGPDVYTKLERELGRIGCRVIRPKVTAGE
ncbi:MAG: GHMP kinase [bacterium]|nr:GHMP kinase [bacterium]